MERYNIIVKIEKIRRYLEQGELANAVAVATSINKNKIKSMADLSVLAEAYFQNGRYQEAKEIFLKIYAKAKSRRILAQLVHLSIKLNDVKEAQQYLEEFIQVAPNDFYRYIFQYNIDKLQGKDISLLIEDLEKLNREEYMESWAYELAKLYHKAGEKEKCISECSNIALWFGSGVYVDKAKALKAYYLGGIDITGLSDNEQQKSKQQENDQEENDQQENDQEENDQQENDQQESKQQEKEQDIAEQVREILREQEQKEEQIEEQKEEKKEPNEEEIYSIPNNENGIKEPLEEYNETKSTLFRLEELHNNEFGIDENSALYSLLEEKNILLVEVFKNFARMNQVRNQIVECINVILVQDYKHVNLLLSGESKSGKTHLAKAFSKLIYLLNTETSPKVAIIDAEKLNTVNIKEKQEQLSGCTLVIERAGNLSEECISVLLELEKEDNLFTMLVLEDTQEQINKLLVENGAVKDAFHMTLTLPKYTLEDYMGFILEYLKEREYDISVDAYEEIEKLLLKQVNEKKEYTLESVFSDVNNIVKRAETRSAKQLLMIAQTGKYVDSDLMVIRKQDVDITP